MKKNLQFYSILFILIAILIIGSLGIFKQFQDKSTADTLIKTIFDENKQTYVQVYQLSKELPASLANDYTYWDELVDYVEKPDPEWAQQNLDTSFSTYKENFLIVLNKSKQVVYSRDVTMPDNS